MDHFIDASQSFTALLLPKGEFECCEGDYHASTLIFFLRSRWWNWWQQYAHCMFSLPVEFSTIWLVVICWIACAEIGIAYAYGAKEYFSVAQWMTMIAFISLHNVCSGIASSSSPLWNNRKYHFIWVNALEWEQEHSSNSFITRLLLSSYDHLIFIFSIQAHGVWTRVSWTHQVCHQWCICLEDSKQYQQGTWLVPLYFHRTQ